MTEYAYRCRTDNSNYERVRIERSDSDEPGPRHMSLIWEYAGTGARRGLKLDLIVDGVAVVSFDQAMPSVLTIHGHRDLAVRFADMGFIVQNNGFAKDRPFRIYGTYTDARVGPSEIA